MTKQAATGDDQSLNTFGLSYTVTNSFALAVTEAASASTGTSVTGSSTATNHASNDAKGQMLVANSAADWSGTTIYGVVQSNTSGTAPVYTVDRWYTLAGANSGSTPATGAGNHYLVLPCMAPFWFVGLASDTAAVTTGSNLTGTNFGTELSGSGLTRQIVTSITRTPGSAITYTISLATTFTYTGSTAQPVGRSALLNSTVPNKDFLYFVDQINGGTAATVSQNGDTLQITYNVTVG